MNTLDPKEFQNLIETLCKSAAEDFAATRSRLEHLRRVGPDDDQASKDAR
ncbi:MAG: hypothetical protein Q8O67_10095 [Deltaproteobacteria bacterium]|nr:hypothetical protein [Deltaproteobacteria bacterium]